MTKVRKATAEAVIADNDVDTTEDVIADNDIDTTKDVIADNDVDTTKDVGADNDVDTTEDVDAITEEEDFKRTMELDLLDRLSVDVLFATEDGNIFYEKDKSLAIDHATKNNIKWIEVRR